jgi:hypothetical protein
MKLHDTFEFVSQRFFTKIMRVHGGFIYYNWFDDDPGIASVFVPYNESEASDD